MILSINIILTCVIIFPFCQFYTAATSETDLNVTLLANYSSFFHDDCRFLLESFANASGEFLFCAISNARPITLCRDCVQSYVLAVKVHGDILELLDRGGELCKQKLLNLDRLQVVEGSFGFIFDLWKRAKCDSCYKILSNHKKELKNEIKEVLKLQNETDVCIKSHENDTEFGVITDPNVCYECKQQYLELNAYYNSLELASPICMDIIDMLNTTRQYWSVSLKCCLDRKTPEYIFLVSSGIISILPVLFYLLACSFAGKKNRQVILLRNHCSIPHPGYVPPTSEPPAAQVSVDDIPTSSSSNLAQSSSDKI